MNRSKFLLIGFLVILTGCASTHSGKMAMSQGDTSIGMRLSAKEVAARNRLFALLEVTIENTTDEWLRIESIRPDLTDKYEKLSVVLGPDLDSWTEAMLVEEARDNYNKEMAKLGLIVAGIGLAAIGSANNDQVLGTVGAVAAIGGYGWALADAFSHAYKKSVGIESKVPSNHLFESFSVPPKMAVRKWILFNRSRNFVNENLVFNVQTVTGLEGRYAISDI
jgi:hypothetical protein